MDNHKEMPLFKYDWIALNVTITLRLAFLKSKAKIFWQ